MTVAIPVHRALATKLTGRSLHVVARWSYNPSLQRVNHNSQSDSNTSSTTSCQKPNAILSVATRSYATTAAAKPASRPKAHTGRVAAKRTTGTAAAKKPGPKTAEGKAKVGSKPAAAKAETKPKAKPKPKPKPKPKAAPKKAVKKVPSKNALNKARVQKEKALKAKALLDTPKALPSTPWTIIFREAHHKGVGLPEAQAATKAAAEKLKNLSPEEKEHYNHLAHTNKEKNENALKKWLSSHTPEQIKDANTARRQLAAAEKAKHPERKSVKKYPAIQDERLVKRPQTPFVQFTKHRHASGDFVRMPVAESARLIGREWKELSTAQKKPYQDDFQTDHNRYIEEYKSVYGTDSPTAAKTT